MLHEYINVNNINTRIKHSLLLRDNRILLLNYTLK